MNKTNKMIKKNKIAGRFHPEIKLNHKEGGAAEIRQLAGRGVDL